MAALSLDLGFWSASTSVLFRDATRSRISRSRAAWSSGLELELIGFDHSDRQRITPGQVRSILERLCPDQRLWEREGDDIVAVTLPSGRITLEPGGQIEFSGSAHRTLDEIEIDLHAYLDDLVAAGDALGIDFFAVGFDPIRRLDEQRWIKKLRYDVMRPYLGARGARAWDMMTRTASIQTSIDYCDDTDLGKKFVLGNRLGPIVAAMFANSPFADEAGAGTWKTNTLSLLALLGLGLAAQQIR